MGILQEPQFLQLAELFNYLDDVRVWIKDRDGRISWVNRTTLVLYSPDDPQGRDILGKTDHDLFPAFLADQFLADDEYVLAGNRIVDRVELSHLPDGTTVWHVTNKIPLRGRDGAIIGTAGSTRPLDKSWPARCRGLNSLQFWLICETITTRRSPMRSWPGWRTCRCGLLNGSF